MWWVKRASPTYKQRGRSFSSLSKLLLNTAQNFDYSHCCEIVGFYIMKFYLLSVEKLHSKKTDKDYFVANILDMENQVVTKNVFVNEEFYGDFYNENYVDVSKYFTFSPLLIDNKICYEVRFSAKSYSED